MNKTLAAAALAALFAASCGGSHQTTPAEAASGGQTSNQAASGRLNIYIWSDYTDPATVQDFSKKHRISVTEAYYDSNEVLESHILTGRSGFDLAVPSLSNAGRQIKAGAYRPIDKSKIPNYRHIDPELLKLMEQVDPGNRYAVPYFWGINTLAVNKKMVAKALGGDKLPDNRWDLVFNPEYTAKLKSCGISFFDSPTEQFPLVLNYLGKDPNSESPEDLQAAADLVTRVRHDIRRFSSSGYIDNLAKGELCVAVGYGGDLNIAKRRAEEAGGGIEIEVLAPKSGVGIWVDSLMIPKDAKNPDNAHAYINHTLDPETAAQNGSSVTYAPASKPARALMDPALAQDASIFPGGEALKNGFVILPKSKAAIKLQSRLWQNIKAGK